MPFQAIPLALRKSTGSPLSKLLLIYLTGMCELPAKGDGLFQTSKVLEFRADDAAAFCQASEREIYDALGQLERLRLVAPDEGWLWNLRSREQAPEDRWDFLVVRLPIAWAPAEERSRIKATGDQIAAMREADSFWTRGRCPACGAHEDEVGRWVVDHIIPRSVGGADVEENCQAICDACNARKGNRVHWVDFMGARR